MAGPNSTRREDRERLLRGWQGEHLAMDFFDEYGIAYWAIEQSEHSKSASHTWKRPDFLIWNDQGDKCLVEAKNLTAHQVSGSIAIDYRDVSNLEHNARTLGMLPLLAFRIGRCLFFVKPSTLIAPQVAGQPFRLELTEGPAHIPPAFRPEWVPRNPIVSWDPTAGKGFGLNANLTIGDLFV